MAEHPVIYARNLLEDAILTMLPDGPVAGHGPERLVDRDLGLACEDVGTTGMRVWLADRGLGASAPTVDAWLFSGSGYAGETVTLASSPDGLEWTTRGTVVPVDDGPQRVLVTPFASPRYLRVSVVDPTQPIRFTEIFVSQGVSLTYRPSARALHEPVQPMLTRLETASGHEWRIQRGPRRWSTTYRVSAAPTADRVAVLEILDTLADGAKPCWLWTVLGELRWVYLQGAIEFPAADWTAEAWDVELSFLEARP